MRIFYFFRSLESGEVRTVDLAVNTDIEQQFVVQLHHECPIHARIAECDSRSGFETQVSEKVHRLKR